LRPSGLEGAVIISTGDKPSEAAVSRFVRQVGNESIVVVVVGDGTTDGLVDLLLSKDAKTVTIVKVADAAEAGAPRVFESIKNARGLWLRGSMEPAKLSTILSPLALTIRELRLRGGVVAASGPAAWLMATRYLDADGRVCDGLGVLPAMLLGRDAPSTGNALTFEAALEQSPGFVGVRLAERAALSLGGRDIRSLGSARVSLLLSRSATRDARTIGVSSARPTDYNEMRRAAAGRTQATPYPPKNVADPIVPKGSLVIVGGGGMSAEIAKRFVELGGGAKGTFIVLPISNPDPIPGNTGDGFMKRFGAMDIHIIKAREQKDLETPENLAALKRATAVWFGGGRQWRFVDAYEGTKIPDLFRDVLRRGGVIGGSSAGATIQGDYLCRGAPGGPNNIICEGYEQGLRFLPGVAIDQHFAQRNRFKDMTLLMKTYPQFLGIGLDEGTAIIVQGQVAEIMGPGQVHFYDRRKPVEEGKPDHDSFNVGNRYDLKERKLLGVKESK
jgi:cyanophycinase